MGDIMRKNLPGHILKKKGQISLRVQAGLMRTFILNRLEVDYPMFVHRTKLGFDEVMTNIL